MPEGRSPDQQEKRKDLRTGSGSRERRGRQKKQEGEERVIKGPAYNKEDLGVERKIEVGGGLEYPEQ